MILVVKNRMRPGYMLHPINGDAKQIQIERRTNLSHMKNQYGSTEEQLYIY